MLDLELGDGEASLDRLLGLAAPSAKTVFQLQHRRRQDEDARDVGHLRPDLPRALIVDVEDDAAGLRLRFDAIDLGGRRAVEISVHLGPLEERTGVRHLLEARSIDEVILATVLLA